MKQHEFEELFLDYVEGTLSETPRLELEAELNRDAVLAQKLKDYRSIIALESRAAAVQTAPSLGFATRVIEATKEREENFIRRLYMNVLAENKRWFATGATVLAAGLLVVLANRTPQEMITITRPAANSPTENIAPLAPPPAKLEERLAKVDSISSADKKLADAVREAPLRPEAEIKSKPAVRVDGRGQGGEIVYSDDRISSSTSTVLQALQGITGARSKEADIGGGAALGEAAPYIETQRGRSMVAGDGVAKSAIVGQAEHYSDSLIVMPEPQTNMQAFEQRERYIGEKPSQPLLTAQNGVSTFSIDVDTASYTNIRRYLQSGHLPPADAVRTEEFVNYFDYNYPEQFNRRFGVHYEVAPSPLIKGHHLLKIGIRAKDIKDSDKPWNLVFLVDVSGSMSAPNKLALLQQSLKILAANMRPQDKVALVTYANGSAVKLESTSGSNKAAITSAIDSLSAGGGTNGEGGIQLAYEVALRNKIDSGVNRVILATDGDFNVGVTSHEALVKMIEEKRKLGVSLTTIGVGDGNLNDATLEQLADKGNGNYFYLDTFKEARKVFEKQLAGTIETVAKDVKLQIEFNPKHVVQYKLIGFENRTLARQDFNNDAVDAGEIGSGHTVTALYDLVLAGTDAAKEVGDHPRYQDPQPTAAPTSEGQFPAELGFLKIRSKGPDSDRSDLEEFPVLRTEIRTSLDGASQDFRFAAAVAAFAESLRGNNMLPLSDIATLAQANRGSDESGIRQEFIELIKNAQALTTR